MPANPHEPLTDKDLQLWVERVSSESFRLPFRHRARFNERLRTTGGRYFTHSHDIEISRALYDAFGREETEAVIKHELCHYHLHLNGLGYRHADDEFKRLLKRVGGTRYCKPAKPRAERTPHRYALTCGDCGQQYLRRRKVNVAKYVCGRCRGALRLTSLKQP